ncbi:MAG TPA: DUF167 domain-containing protein [Acidimicrobiales bacterium]|nr:DUF167 domain-containing protein [Acidimicrobiales bacterium]
MAEPLFEVESVDDAAARAAGRASGSIADSAAVPAGSASASGAGGAAEGGTSGGGTGGGGASDAGEGGASGRRRAGSATIVLRVHVQPAAGRASVVGRYGDALHVRVAAPPVGGRANQAAGELIAEVLDVKPSQVSLAGGERSRSKRYRVREVDVDDVTRRLDVALEQAGRRGPPAARDRGRR